MPDPTGAREIVRSGQVWDEEADKAIAVVAAWKEDGKYDWARLPPDADFEAPNLDGAKLHEISRIETFFGEFKEGKLEAPLASQHAKDVYIKRPNVYTYAIYAFDVELEKEKGITETAEAAQKADAQVRSDIAAAFRRLHLRRGASVRGDMPEISLSDFMSDENAKRKEELEKDPGKESDTKEERDPKDRVSMIIKGVRAGLDHLHGLGYVHNDVTPESIMIEDDDNPVLTDFSACGRLRELVDDPVETPGYVVESTATHEAKKDDLIWEIVQKELEERKRPFSNA
ncbi:hypothetical protein F5I97DRAFT_1967788 [Phlebopus sp. FC_14]|nr:hypothetical protein F5I97DRAFT_1967788 [Phlebopus sp. FC_14]